MFKNWQKGNVETCSLKDLTYAVSVLTLSFKSIKKNLTMVTDDQK